VALTTMMIRRNESLLLMEAKLVLVLAVVQDLFFASVRHCGRHERDMSCFVVWGRGEDREGELKLCRGGGGSPHRPFIVFLGLWLLLFFKVIFI